MSVHIAFETPQDVQEQVYEMVKSLGKDGKGRLKKGANEVTKAAERGTAQMIVMAENVNPGELLAHIPMICKGEVNTFHLRKRSSIPSRSCWNDNWYSYCSNCSYVS